MHFHRYQSSILSIVIAGAVAYAQATPTAAPNSEFRSVVSRYVGQNQLLATGTVIIGTGETAKTGTVDIKIDRDKNSTLAIIVGNEHLSQVFQFRGGRPTCVATSATNPTSRRIEGLCGTPAPWFFPLPFLSKLPGSLFQIAPNIATDANSFTVKRSDLLHGEEMMTSHAWESHLIFDSAGRLTQYSYPISPYPGSRHPIYVDVTYDSYKALGNAIVPYHIHQSIDGQTTLDLTITSITQRVQ